jgi:hypothetical protein
MHGSTILCSLFPPSLNMTHLFEGKVKLARNVGRQNHRRPVEIKRVKALRDGARIDVVPKSLFTIF